MANRDMNYNKRRFYVLMIAAIVVLTIAMNVIGKVISAVIGG